MGAGADSAEDSENSWAFIFRNSSASAVDPELADDVHSRVEASADSSGRSSSSDAESTEDEVEEAYEAMERYFRDSEEAEVAQELVDFTAAVAETDQDEAARGEQEGEGAMPTEQPAQPPLPMPRPAPAVIMAGPRLPAEAVVTWPGLGKVAFHHSKASFEATCFLHPQCVISRTSHGRPVRGHGLVAGRPLGFLACWIHHATSCADKTAHWERDGWRTHFSLEARQAARRALLELPGGTALAANERPRGPGEADEPDTLTGLL